MTISSVHREMIQEMTEDPMLELREKIKGTFVKIEAAIENHNELEHEAIAIELDSLSRAFAYSAGYLRAAKEAKQIIDEKED